MYAEELAQKVSLLKRPGGADHTALVSARAARVSRVSSGDSRPCVETRWCWCPSRRRRPARSAKGRPFGREKKGVRFLTRLAAAANASAEDRSVGGGAHHSTAGRGSGLLAPRSGNAAPPDPSSPWGISPGPSPRSLWSSAPLLRRAAAGCASTERPPASHEPIAASSKPGARSCSRTLSSYGTFRQRRACRRVGWSWSPATACAWEAPAVELLLIVAED